MDGGAVEVGFAPQVVLGQRRSLVGTGWFVTDEHDSAIEAFAAQGFGGLGAGQAGAHNDERLRCRHYLKVANRWALSVSRLSVPRGPTGPRHAVATSADATSDVEGIQGRRSVTSGRVSGPELGVEHRTQEDDVDRQVGLNHPEHGAGEDAVHGRIPR